MTVPESTEEPRIGELMHRDVVCVSPDTSVRELRDLLLERGISGAPVVDGEGRPMGIVSKTDVLRACAKDRVEHAVSEIMMPLSFSLTESAPVSQAAALMAFEGIHRVVVVDMNGRVVGILSSLDVLRWLAKRAGYVVGD